VAEVASEPCPDCEVQAVVSFYGVYDMLQLAEQPAWKDRVPHWFLKPSPEVLRESSPLYRASPGMPPTLLIQGTEDPLYQGTLNYKARLEEVHARYKLILLDGAPHGMEDWEGHPEWLSYKREMLEWLSGILRQSN